MSELKVPQDPELTAPDGSTHRLNHIASFESVLRTVTFE